MKKKKVKQIEKIDELMEKKLIKGKMRKKL